MKEGPSVETPKESSENFKNPESSLGRENVKYLVVKPGVVNVAIRYNEGNGVFKLAGKDEYYLYGAFWNSITMMETRILTSIARNSGIDLKTFLAELEIYQSRMAGVNNNIVGEINTILAKSGYSFKQQLSAKYTGVIDEPDLGKAIILTFVWKVVVH